MGEWDNIWKTACRVDVCLDSGEGAHFAEGIAHTSKTVLEITDTISVKEAISSQAHFTRIVTIALNTVI